jgi:hypothetical protein
MAFKSTLEARKRVASSIDTSALDYLQRGDITRVADKIKEDRNYVSRVKNLKAYNVKILAALIKQGLENKKLLTQQ